MLMLNTIRAHAGATTSRKRLGRGSGSGLGKTAGKGHKGQLARSGGVARPGFEGGQMPLYRRIPKRGFTNNLRRATAVLNVTDLDRLASQGIKEFTLEVLTNAGAIKGRYEKLNILGNGELSKAVKVKAHKLSESAQEKIKKAGGSFELIKIEFPKGKLQKSKKYQTK